MTNETVEIFPLCQEAVNYGITELCSCTEERFLAELPLISNSMGEQNPMVLSKLKIELDLFERRTSGRFPPHLYLSGAYMSYKTLTKAAELKEDGILPRLSVEDWRIILGSDHGANVPILMREFQNDESLAIEALRVVGFDESTSDGKAVLIGFFHVYRPFKVLSEINWVRNLVSK